MILLNKTKSDNLKVIRSHQYLIAVSLSVRVQLRLLAIRIRARFKLCFPISMFRERFPASCHGSSTWGRPISSRICNINSPGGCPTSIFRIRSRTNHTARCHEDVEGCAHVPRWVNYLFVTFIKPYTNLYSELISFLVVIVK